MSAIESPHVDVQAWPIKALVETDWFCETCGYNLIGQHVRLNPELSILLVRCPECASFFHPARQTTVHSLWGRRLAGFAGAAYILFTVVVELALGAACFGLALGTVEAQTTIDWADYQRQLQTFQTAATQPGATAVRPNLTIKRVLDTNMEYRSAFLALMYALAFVVPFMAVGLLTVLQHHWRRRYYVCVATFFATAAPAIAALVYFNDVPDLFQWAVPFIASHAGVILAGGVLAAFAGRICARGLIRALLPPGWRPLFSALWLADGYAPPPPLTPDATRLTTAGSAGR